MTLVFFISTLIFAYLYFEEKRKNKQYRTATQTVASEATVSAEANPAMVAQPQVQVKKTEIEEAQEYWAKQQLRAKSAENAGFFFAKVIGIGFICWYIFMSLTYK